MVRCPFNNFSKCNNECPFAEDDATRCGLQRGMAAIEGVARGIHANASVTKNHAIMASKSAEAVAKSAAALVASVGKMSQPAPEQPEQPRLALDDEEKPAPMFAEEWIASRGAAWFVGKTTGAVWAMFNAACEDGKAVKRTRVKVSWHVADDREITQRTLTSLVRHVYPFITAVRANNGRDRHMFVRVATVGDAE